MSLSSSLLHWIFILLLINSGCVIAHQEALKKEIERLRNVYEHQQNLGKMERSGDDEDRQTSTNNCFSDDHSKVDMDPMTN